MKKLSCAVLKDDADRLMKALQKLSIVEIIKTETSDGVCAVNVSGESAGVNSDTASVKRAIEFLLKYDTSKHSLFSPPLTADADSYDAEKERQIMSYVKSALDLSSEIAQLTSKSAELSAEISALTPYCGWDISLPEDRTAHTVTVSGTLPQNIRIDTVEEKFSSLMAVVSVIKEEEKGAHTVSVTSHKDDMEAVRKILASCGFSKCAMTAGKADGYADGKTEKLKKELSGVKGQLELDRKKAVKLAGKLEDIKAYHDILTSKAAVISAKAHGAETEKTVLLTGWVPAPLQEKTEKLLTEYGAAYEFCDPEEGDDVPVSLSNNAFAKNFEPVMAMFSLPAYKTFDPTALMSVFYVVIFGLMFADVGYGAILLAGCLAGLKLLHPKEGLKRMMKMFAFCAVACIIGGVLFGGYFGDLPNALRQNFGGATDVKSPAVMFDMIENPMGFLVVSLIMGAVHLLCGMGIKFYILAKSGHWFDAVFDVGSWYVLFLGLGLYALIGTPGLIVAGVGALMLICTQGRQEKSIIMKIGKGVLSLYDIVSYASDLLSYSRILALGLASAVIASVVNLLGTMGGPTVGGIILFIFVFLIGHIINFLVNILGTYVHTSRLQYIEFFGKFFESGGKEFSPLTYETKYVDLK